MKLVLIATAAVFLLNACGFTLPNQTKISTSIPKLNICGDYHDSFYKFVKRELTVSGVKVIEDCSLEVSKDLPKLSLPNPYTNQHIVSIDSKAQALEYNLTVGYNATLFIFGHRAIVMQNSLTRSTLNKPGHYLAAENEKRFLRSETLEELATQLVMRIGYLGRQSDPDLEISSPAELTIAKDKDSKATTIKRKAKVKQSLIESLQQSDGVISVDLDELNNGQEILHDLPKLPSTPVQLLN